jgi:hypothetical protein
MRMASVAARSRAASAALQNRMRVAWLRRARAPESAHPVRLGVFKNVIDWLSRPSDDIPRASSGVSP